MAYQKDESQALLNHEDFSTYFIVPESVSQYTGLASSDGGCNLPIKEAYFGDVIRFYNTDGKEHQAEIIWHEHEHCIGFKRLSDGFVYTQKIFNDSGYFQPSKLQFEILGNVYENPELLSAKTEA